MTIGERIKTARKQLGLTQAEFAENIGLKPTAVLMYEKGSRNVTEQSIALIVQTYKISEDWLRSGSGSMFRADDGTIISQLAEQYHLDAAQEALIRSFLSLSSAQRDAVVAAVRRAASDIESFAVSASEKPDLTDEQKKLAERAAIHAALDEELDAQEKGLSVSTSGSIGTTDEKQA